jgi:hypothetical protein
VLGDDLSLWRQISAQNIRGIIGMATLKKYIVQIDSDLSTVRFLRPNTRIEKPGTAEEFELRFNNAGDGIEVRVVVERESAISNLDLTLKKTI